MKREGNEVICLGTSRCHLGFVQLNVLTVRRPRALGELDLSARELALALFYQKHAVELADGRRASELEM